MRQNTIKNVITVGAVQWRAGAGRGRSADLIEINGGVVEIPRLELGVQDRALGAVGHAAERNEVVARRLRRVADLNVELSG